MKKTDKSDVHFKILQKAWKDPVFKQKLLANPKAIFQEMGIEVPKNRKIRIVEAAPNEDIFVLPQPPLDVTDLSDEDLQKMYAAGCKKTCPWSVAP